MDDPSVRKFAIAGSCCSGRVDIGGLHALAEVKEDPDFNAANDAGITASPSRSRRLQLWLVAATLDSKMLEKVCAAMAQAVLQYRGIL